MLSAIEARERGIFDAYPALRYMAPIKITQITTLEIGCLGQIREVKVTSEIDSIGPGRGQRAPKRGPHEIRSRGQENAVSTSQSLISRPRLRPKRRETIMRGALREAFEAAGFDNGAIQRESLLDATREYATFRESGRFGSHPSHDNYNEE